MRVPLGSHEVPTALATWQGPHHKSEAPMTDSASQLKGWELFFSTVSLSAATLAGLLIV
jgi:hypothetical protein